MKKFSLPVKKINADGIQKKPKAASEKKIADLINKGGSVTKKEAFEPEIFKNFNIRILQDELRQINDLRDKMPKLRGKKKAISTHDWIIEAIQEKIERDTKKVK